MSMSPSNKEMNGDHHPELAQEDSSANAMARAYTELLSSTSALNFRQTRLDMLRALTNDGTATPTFSLTPSRRHSSVAPETPQRTSPPSVPMMNSMLMRTSQQSSPSSVLTASLQDSLSDPTSALLAKLDQKPAGRRHSLPLGVASSGTATATDTADQASIPLLLAKLRNSTHRQSLGGLSSSSIDTTKTPPQQETSTISDMGSLLGYLRNQTSRRSSLATPGGLATAVAAAHRRPSMDHMSIAEMKSLYGKLPSTPPAATKPTSPDTMSLPVMNRLYARLNRLNEPTTLRNSFWYQDQQQQEQSEQESLQELSSKKRAASDDKQQPKKKRCRRTRDEQWNLMYDRLVQYKKKHGDCLVHWQYKEDIQLGRWVSKQREYRHDLSEDRRERLDKIGFVWVATGVSHQNQWDEMFERLVKYKKEHGHCQVPWLYQEDRKLVGWVQNQRRRKHTLSPERKARLDAIGFAWEGIRGKYTRVPGKHKRIKKGHKLGSKKTADGQKETEGSASVTTASSLSSSSEDESVGSSVALSKTKTTFTAQEDEIILKAIVGNKNSKGSSNNDCVAVASSSEPDLGYWEMLRGLAHNKSVEDLYQRATELSIANKRAQRKAKEEEETQAAAKEQEATTVVCNKPSEATPAPPNSPTVEAQETPVAMENQEEPAPKSGPVLQYATPPQQEEHPSPVHVLMLAATAAAAAEEAAAASSAASSS